MMPKMPEFEILSVQKQLSNNNKDPFDKSDPKIELFNSQFKSKMIEMLESGLIGVDDAFELFDSFNSQDSKFMQFESLPKEEQLKIIRSKIESFDPLSYTTRLGGISLEMQGALDKSKQVSSKK